VIVLFFEAHILLRYVFLCIQKAFLFGTLDGCNIGECVSICDMSICCKLEKVQIKGKMGLGLDKISAYQLDLYIVHTKILEDE